MDEALTIEASLRTAGLATVTLTPVATAIGLWLARRTDELALGVESVVMAPLVVPPVVTGLALAWLVGLDGPLGQALAEAGWRLPDELGRVITAVLAGAVVGLPLFVRAVRRQRELVDDRLISAARSLGAGPVRTFTWITLPHVWRGIAIGASLAFARALGEYGATLLVAGPLPTLPFAIAHAADPLGDPSILRLALLSLGVAVAAVIATQTLARRAL
ncbi:MAG: ABC transporter permease subunit [Myxococcota bacterium]